MYFSLNVYVQINIIIILQSHYSWLISVFSVDNVAANVYTYNVDNGLYEYSVTLQSNRVRGMAAFNINGRMFIFVTSHYEGAPSHLFVISDAGNFPLSF